MAIFYIEKVVRIFRSKLLRILYFYEMYFFLSEFKYLIASLNYSSLLRLNKQIFISKGGGRKPLTARVFLPKLSDWIETSANVILLDVYL